MAARNDDSFDYVFKIVLVGDSGTGKTNLLSRFTRNVFNRDSRTTLGVEFASKQVDIGGNKIKAQIWDTVGQERFQAITQQFYHSALGALLVYDITSQESFESLEKDNGWLAQLKQHAHPNIVRLCVGNKCDLSEDRAVSVDEAFALAERHTFPVLETSAKDSINVESAFTELLTEIFRLVRDESLCNPESNQQSFPVLPGDGDGPGHFRSPVRRVCCGS